MDLKRLNLVLIFEAQTVGSRLNRSLWLVVRSSDLDVTLFHDINGLARYTDRANDVFEFFAQYGPFVFVGLLLC